MGQGPSGGPGLTQALVLSLFGFFCLYILGADQAPCRGAFAGSPEQRNSTGGQRVGGVNV